MINRNRLPVYIVAFVTMTCLAFFANKAFHADDPLFLWTANQILSHPFDFYGCQVNWYGTLMPIYEIAQNPPLASYYIAIIALPFGFNGIVLHIAFILPAVLAAIGTYYLAAKFCTRPALAAMAAVLTPAFLVSSTNIMCDTMMLAFWVWTILLWINAVQTGKHLHLFFAAILIAACALTKYFGMTLIPLLLAYSIMQKRKFTLSILYLLLPIVILTAYHLLTFKLYSKGLLTDAAAYALTTRDLINSDFSSKGFTGLLFTGGCLISALFYCPLIWSKKIIFSGLAAALLLIFLLTSVEKIGVCDLLIKVPGTNSIKWGLLFQISFMALAGVNILALAVTDFLKHKNAYSLLLLLWVFGTFIFAAFINWSINARSILPIAPAVGILLMRRFDLNKTKTPKHDSLLKSAWPLIPAALLSLLVCWADYSLANSARQAADSIWKTFENSNRTVWFQGHWGFQFYMESFGAKAFRFDHPELSAKGDIIIFPDNNTNLYDLPQNAALLFNDLFFFPCRYLATMDARLGAAFYSDNWGPLPFAAGNVTPEKYSIFIIQAPENLIFK